MAEKQDGIPQNSRGVQTNTESETELGSVDEAKELFAKVRQRLLHVNEWHKIAGKLSADFQLTDANGEEVNRAAQKGDHFRIDIPGPGPATGDGYDWVQVENIEDNEDKLVILVRPATNPKNERADVAHFFSEEATSSFMVRRERNKIIAGVYGRNEKPNTAAATAVDKVRNTAIATGAITGFSKLQWKSLVNGLIKKDF